MKLTYTLEGLHCSSCVQKVISALKPFADKVEVTLVPPRAILEGADIPAIAILNESLATAGSYRLRESMPEEDATHKGWVKTYYPLLLIVGLISVASFNGAASVHDWMIHFMAGFFIVFGFFKLLDIRGFRDAYAGYDLLARRWGTYGYIYPFLEVGLGFAFLFQFQLEAALWLSIILMIFGSLGVIKALTEKRRIRCACLGTVLNLPMSTITLVEDLGMAAMSIFMVMSF